MDQESGALTARLAITTAGMVSKAWLASGRISSRGTMPNATAFTIMKTIAAICKRIARVTTTIDSLAQFRSRRTGRGEQETLMREMSHRIKNLFSVADSMVRLTARSAATKEELTEALSGRLHALAQRQRPDQAVVRHQRRRRRRIV
jgi:two-component sensor histidine kinase